MLLQWFRDELV